MMKEEPIQGSGTPACSPGERAPMAMASTAEPTQDCNVSEGHGMDGGRHQRACSTSISESDNGTFISSTESKVLAILKDLQEYLRPKRKENFTGGDIVTWLKEKHGFTKASGGHFVYLLTKLGYMVHIPSGPRSNDTRASVERNRYRLQVAEFLPTNTDFNTYKNYAIYLYRVIELSSNANNSLPYEKETLGALRTMLAADWPEIGQTARDNRRRLKGMPAEDRHIWYHLERKYWRIVRPARNICYPLTSAKFPWLEGNLVTHLGIHTSISSASTAENNLARRRTRSFTTKETRPGKKKRSNQATSLPSARMGRLGDLQQCRPTSASYTKQNQQETWLQALHKHPTAPAMVAASLSLSEITGRTESFLDQASSGGCISESPNHDAGAVPGTSPTCAAGVVHNTVQRSRSGSPDTIRASRGSPVSPLAKILPSHPSIDQEQEPSKQCNVGYNGDMIEPLPVRSLLEREIQSAEARLHQPYLPIGRVLTINLKQATERRDLDLLLCSSMPTAAGNRWVQAHAEPQEQVTMAVSAHHLRMWAISFDTLLRDPRGFLEFEIFLQKEYAGENIAFWKEAEVYRNLPASQLANRATLLYKDFIQQNCMSQINIPATVHLEICKEKDTGATRMLFDKAQKQVYNLMRKDSYGRFLQSKQYKDLLSMVPRSARQSLGLFRTLKKGVRTPSVGSTSTRTVSTTRELVPAAGRNSAPTARDSINCQGSPVLHEKQQQSFDFSARFALGKKSSAEKPASPTKRSHVSAAAMADILSNPTGGSQQLSRQQSEPSKFMHGLGRKESAANTPTGVGPEMSSSLPMSPSHSPLAVSPSLPSRQLDGSVPGSPDSSAPPSCPGSPIPSRQSPGMDRKLFSLPLQNLMSPGAKDSHLLQSMSGPESQDSCQRVLSASMGVPSLSIVSTSGRSSLMAATPATSNDKLLADEMQSQGSSGASHSKVAKKRHNERHCSAEDTTKPSEKPSDDRTIRAVLQRRFSRSPSFSATSSSRAASRSPSPNVHRTKHHSIDSSSTYRPPLSSHLYNDSNGSSTKQRPGSTGDVLDGVQETSAKSSPPGVESPPDSQVAHSPHSPMNCRNMADDPQLFSLPLANLCSDSSREPAVSLEVAPAVTPAITPSSSHESAKVPETQSMICLSVVLTPGEISTTRSTDDKDAAHEVAGLQSPSGTRSKAGSLVSPSTPSSKVKRRLLYSQQKTDSAPVSPERITSKERSPRRPSLKARLGRRFSRSPSFNADSRSPSTEDPHQAEDGSGSTSHKSTNPMQLFPARRLMKQRSVSTGDVSNNTLGAATEGSSSGRKTSDVTPPYAGSPDSQRKGT